MMEDNSPPSKRAALATGIALVVAGTFGFLLFSGYLPGAKPDYTPPTTVSVDGRPYYWSNYYFPWPLWPHNTTTPTNASLHNATFWVWVTGWYEAGGGFVHGNASEPNGSVVSFVLGGPSDTPDRATLYLSPDGAVGAMWTGAAYLQLLVVDRTAT